MSRLKSEAARVLRGARLAVTERLKMRRSNNLVSGFDFLQPIGWNGWGNEPLLVIHVGAGRELLR